MDGYIQKKVRYNLIHDYLLLLTVFLLLLITDILQPAKNPISSLIYSFLYGLLLLAAIVLIIYHRVQIRRFREMIARQEAQYGVTFPTGQAGQPIDGQLIYLDGDWLIDCGRAALYFDFITELRFDCQLVRGKYQNTIHPLIIADTADGKTYRLSLSPKAQGYEKQITHWYKRRRQLKKSPSKNQSHQKNGQS